MTLPHFKMVTTGSLQPLWVRHTGLSAHSEIHSEHALIVRETQYAVQIGSLEIQSVPKIKCHCVQQALRLGTGCIRVSSSANGSRWLVFEHRPYSEINGGRAHSASHGALRRPHFRPRDVTSGATRRQVRFPNSKKTLCYLERRLLIQFPYIKPWQSLDRLIIWIWTPHVVEPHRNRLRVTESAAFRGPSLWIWTQPLSE